MEGGRVACDARDARPSAEDAEAGPEPSTGDVSDAASAGAGTSGQAPRPPARRARRIARRARYLAARHAVLLVAAAAALATMAVVPPDAAYAGYLDLRTIGCLFGILAVVAALHRLGVFERAARLVVDRFATCRGAVAALVGATLVLSMVATNDMALIMMLPLAAATLLEAGWGRALPVAFVLQSLAANLGGMVLPFGNPQNLYLYSCYGIGLGEFVQVMAVPFLVATALVLLACALLARTPDSAPAKMEPVPKQPLGRRRLVAYGLLLGLTVLAVLRIVPIGVAVVAVAVVLARTDRRALRAVDYPLLLTFACFFVFAGNMARMPFLSEALTGLMAADGLLVAAGLSQVISNVPAAVLLSHFTSDWPALLAGVNVGGAGTLVGSLASLITLQHFSSVRKVFPALDGLPELRTSHFLGLFTTLNAGFLAVLLLTCRLCGL